MKPIKQGRIRQQVAYHVSMGMLSYHDTKRVCATITELAGLLEEPDIRKIERLIRRMVRDGELTVCLKHPGGYELSGATLRELGLADRSGKAHD